MRRVFVLGVHFILLGYVFFLSPPAIQSAGNHSQNNDGKEPYRTHWVDSVFHSLSLEERIAQLLMIRVHTDRDQEYYDSIIHLVSEHNIGGAAFFRGSPTQQVLVTNRMQSQVKTPLLIAMDAEWGPAMRLDSLDAFPRQMALGAVQDNDLIYEMGRDIGRKLTRLGVHINFAPVVDVNNNADNPVINFRAFGEDRRLVAEKGLAYMHGMQDEGIMACAKHFPGHGDTDADSHHTLPLLQQSFEEIDSIHLYPFKRLMEQGLQSVMTAHLEIPSLEPESELASTLSHNVVTKLLQMEMGFRGLIITDALDMRGVSDYFEPGELELRALMAGNDILLLPEDVPAAISSIKNAIHDGILPEEYLNYKCRKVLYFKEKAGLDNFRYAPVDDLLEDLNSIRNKLLNKQLVEASLTLVRNQNARIPIKNIAEKRIAALSIGETPDNAFHDRLSAYAPVSRYGIDKYHTPMRAAQMKEQLAKYDLVIISVHDNSFFVSNDYGINGKTVGLIHSIARDQPVILSLFANPYSLAFFDDEILTVDAILVAYQEGELFENAAAEALFNGIQVTGQLPVTAGAHIPKNTGIITAEPTRIRFGHAEQAGIRSLHLQRIDSLAKRGIREQAYPGCQVAIIRDGVMIYEKAFGYHTYDSIRPVRASDLYDLASVTKVAATTMAIMKLHDQGRINLDKGIGSYLPWIENPGMYEVTIRDILAHQAGFESWIPFFAETLNDDGTYMDGIYHHAASHEFPTEVAHDMFLHKNFRDSIFARIANSELSENPEYRYSDLGFILLAEVIEEITGQRLDHFARGSFYMPLGLQNTGFKPHQFAGSERLVPSERDTLWRLQTVHGHVHDPAAAMLGGVSGHAGLFSNAGDLALLMQMIINGGNYGGIQYLEKATVEKFTRAHFANRENRRGLGFDKPSLDREQEGPSAKSASPLSFGHSGFTGTYVWVDPIEDLVFVFLSNRTYPSQSNRKLIEKNIRTNMMQEVYNAIYHSRMLEHFSFIE